MLVNLQEGKKIPKLIFALEFPNLLRRNISSAYLKEKSTDGVSDQAQESLQRPLYNKEAFERPRPFLSTVYKWHHDNLIIDI